MASLPPRLRLAASRYAIVSLRSLALWRVLLGLACVQVVARRWGMLRVFYTETGPYPIAALRERVSAWEIGPLRWVTSERALHVVFALFLLVALAFTAGLWLRVVKWLLLPVLVTLDARTPSMFTGGELVLHLASLYCLFFPLGSVWSVDAWLAERRGAREGETRPTAIQSPAYPLIL